jgi:hypothetical protein
MYRYTLKATMDGVSSGEYIEAHTDDHAAMQAIGIILDNATTNKLWAYGLIELRDIEGRLIREMDPKPMPAYDPKQGLPVFGKMFHKMTGL